VIQQRDNGALTKIRYRKPIPSQPGTEHLAALIHEGGFSGAPFMIV